MFVHPKGPHKGHIRPVYFSTVGNRRPGDTTPPSDRMTGGQIQLEFGNFLHGFAFDDLAAHALKLDLVHAAFMQPSARKPW